MQRTISTIIASLKADGKDTCEAEAMVEAFKEADDLAGIEFYQNQLYGLLVGLTIMGYLSVENINEAMNEMESGNI